MLLIFLEALAAGLILIFIVWWTMFSGRDKGEMRRDEDDTSAGPTDGKAERKTDRNSDKNGD